MIASKKTTLLAGATLALAATAIAGEAAPGTRTEVQKTCKVVMLGGDAAVNTLPPHQIMVTSRSVDGAEPALQVQVLGADGGAPEMIDVASLEDGETRTFTTASGKDVIVSRNEGGVVLSVDGKEINLPSLMNVAVMSGEPGANMATWVSEDGAEHVINTNENVMVFAGGPAPMMGGVGLPGDFSNLQSLEGLEPEVREKVVAALHEILSGGKAGFAFHHMAVAAPGTEGAAAPAPGQRVIVRRVAAPTTAPADGSRVE